MFLLDSVLANKKGCVPKKSDDFIKKELTGGGQKSGVKNCDDLYV